MSAALGDTPNSFDCRDIAMWSLHHQYSLTTGQLDELADVANDLHPDSEAQELAMHAAATYLAAEWIAEKPLHELYDAMQDALQDWEQM